MKSAKVTRNRKNTASMIGLFLVLIALFMMAFQKIEKIVEERCFRVLTDTVEQGATAIRIMVRSDEQRMEDVANMLASYENLNETECQNHLDALQTSNLLSSFSVLLPGNQMIYSNGAAALMETVPDYETESKKGLSFYGIYEGITSEAYSVYSYPIVKNGKTKGVLYGYIRLKDLPEMLEFSAFDDQAQLYLVDGNTGNFLMDTWHDELGNMYDENLAKRKTKAGTEFEQTKKDVENGKAGYVVFESRTTGDDFYSYYSPVGKYNLSFQITVPGEVVFSDAIHIQRIIFFLGSIQILIIVCYTFVKLRSAWMQNRKDQQKIELNGAINEIQRMLFETYENADFVNEPLKLLAGALGAEQLLFVILEKNTVKKLYSSSRMSEEEQKGFLGRNIEKDIQMLSANAGEKRSAAFGEKFREKLERVGKLPGIKAEELRNFAAAWETDTDDNIYSMIYAVNVRDADAGREGLEMASVSFRQAFQTLDSYTLLYQMGEVDSLTGLKNRNAYQKDLEVYDSCSSRQLCCIYVDANGLHDLNNTYGHASGDKMLQRIGYLARELFGFDNAYRIGGDEFVLFCIDVKRHMVLEKIQTLQNRLRQEEYHISVGIAFREEGQHIQQLITNAEMRMYERKRVFYSKDKGQRDSRQHNQELENILLEKKDRDSFLEAISVNYMGVYVVDIVTDKVRTIYKPNYFDDILKRTGFYYLHALQQYAKEYIADEDYERIMEFLDYEKITRHLDKGFTVECCYSKKDGIGVRVRVLPAQDYAQTNKDTLWIFEKYVATETGK